MQVRKFEVFIESSQSDEVLLLGVKNLLESKAGVLWDGISVVSGDTCDTCEAKVFGNVVPFEPEMKAPPADQKIPHGAQVLQIHAGDKVFGIDGLRLAVERISMGMPVAVEGKTPSNFLGFGDTSGNVYSFVDILNAIVDRLEATEEKVAGFMLPGGRS